MSIKRALSGGIVLLALVCRVAIGQVTTSVDKAEVLAVSGNDVVFRMENGEIRDVMVPPGATATVDGRTITVADLKPGMKLQRTITTITTQRTVKSVRVVTGKVLQVNAPYVSFMRDDGVAKRVKVPDGTKFTIDGKETDVFDLKKGMKFTATVITEAPETVVSTKKSVTGSGAPAPAPKPVVAALPANIETKTVLIEEAPAPVPAKKAEAAPTPAPAPAPAAAAAAEPAPKKLPKTGSPMPFIGLLGLAMTLTGAGMRLLRKR